MNPQFSTIALGCLYGHSEQYDIRRAVCAIPITTAIFNRNQLVNIQVRAFCVKAFFAVHAFIHFVRHPVMVCLQRPHLDFGPGFVSMSPNRILKLQGRWRLMI